MVDTLNVEQRGEVSRRDLGGGQAWFGGTSWFNSNWTCFSCFWLWLVYAVEVGCGLVEQRDGGVE